MNYTPTLPCTGSAFKDLVNPYTGLPVKTVMKVREGKPPSFFAPDTYSPMSPHEPGSAPSVDFWTGKVLTHKTDDTGKVWAIGGFDPHRPHPREEYLYYMNMRNGVSTHPTPETQRVEPVPEHVPAPVSHEAPILEGSIEAAEEILKNSGFETQKKTTMRVARKLSKK